MAWGPPGDAGGLEAPSVSRRWCYGGAMTWGAYRWIAGLGWLVCACGGSPSGTAETTGTTAAAPTGDGSTSSSSSTAADATTGTDTGPAADATGDASSGGGLDDTMLRFDHLQALGTHNSYHVAPANSVLPWAYTHRPLDEQLSIGVRQFELDVWRDEASDDFAVFHVDVLDEQTTCATLTDCISTMEAWSSAHPHHHPILVMLEPKDDVDAAGAEAWVAALETTVGAAWPEARMIVPAMVEHGTGSLKDGLAAEGWPSLAELRGRALFVLHTGGALRDAYVAGGLGDRLLFPDAMGDIEADYAAFHSVNDPTDAAAIAEAVALGHLVRTRADADNVEPTAGDVTRRDAALASGAHFVSTDWPEPSPSGYVVEIPGGTPSRCNPSSAPAGCTSEAIEDPAALGP